MKKLLISFIVSMLFLGQLVPSVHTYAKEQTPVNNNTEQQVQEVLKIIEQLEKEYAELYKCYVDTNNQYTPYDYDYVMWYMEFTKKQGFPKLGEEMYEMWQGWVDDILARIDKLTAQLAKYDEEILSNPKVKDRLEEVLDNSQSTGWHFWTKIRDKVSLGLTRDEITPFSAFGTVNDLNDFVDKYVVNGENLKDFFKKHGKEAAVEQIAAEYMYQGLRQVMDDKSARNIAQSCSAMVNPQRINVKIGATDCFSSSLNAMEKTYKDKTGLEHLEKEMAQDEAYNFMQDPDDWSMDLMEFYEEAMELKLTQLLGTWQIVQNDDVGKIAIKIAEQSNGNVKASIVLTEKNIEVPATIVQDLNKAIIRFPVTADILDAFNVNSPRKVLDEVVKKNLTSQYEIYFNQESKTEIESIFRSAGWAYNRNTYRLNSWYDGSENPDGTTTTLKLMHKSFSKKENVSKTKQWKVSLTKNLDPSTVNKETIYVLNDKKQKLKNINVKLGQDKKTVLVSIDGSYEPGTYYLIITTQVQSFDGKRLAQPVEQSFTVTE